MHVRADGHVHVRVQQPADHRRVNVWLLWCTTITLTRRRRMAAVFMCLASHTATRIGRGGPPRRRCDSRHPLASARRATKKFGPSKPTSHSLVARGVRRTWGKLATRCYSVGATKPTSPSLVAPPQAHGAYSPLLGRSAVGPTKPTSHSLVAPPPEGCVTRCLLGATRSRLET